MSVKPIPEGYENVIPYVMCSKTDEVIEFCKKVFDAKVDEISRSDDGSVRHAEIHIRNSAIMFSEARGEYPATPIMLYVYVDNVDEVYKKAIAAGGISQREPTNEFYGDRSGGVKDVSGNQWWFATHFEDVSPEEMKKRQEKK